MAENSPIEHCPQTGKIYILIVVCLVFSGLLISINSLSRDFVDDNLFGTGIAITIIQTMFTLYLIGIDIFGNCKGIGKDCKWFKFNPKFYIPIILLSSAYMIGFGIMDLKSSTDKNDELGITMLSIASVITGSVGFLYVFSELVCTLSCNWL
jgi:hypothetical protein